MRAQPKLDLRTLTERAADGERSALFRALCRRAGLPEPEREYLFAKPDRRWRFDYAWPDRGIALEVEGGVWTGGRHTRGKGFLGDMEKYNGAASRGWLVFRCTPSTLDSLKTVGMLKYAYDAWSVRAPV